MNHKFYCREEWNRLLDNTKGYTFGQCVYAMMSCGKINKADLTKISDAEMLNLIRETIKREQEDEQ
jgi:hypothetical protein